MLMFDDHASVDVDDHRWITIDDALIDDDDDDDDDDDNPNGCDDRWCRWSMMLTMIDDIDVGWNLWRQAFLH